IAELVVYNTESKTEFRLPRGTVKAPNSLKEYSSLRYDPAEQWPTYFSYDSKFLFFTAKKSNAATEIGNRRHEVNCDRSTLVILRLLDGHITEIQNVISYAFPNKSSKYV